MKALGMIETYGVIGAIEAADVMLKVADVSLIKKEKVQGGLQIVTVVGDVGAVKVAVDAAASAVARLGQDLLFGAHVIPRPDDQLENIFEQEKNDINKNSEEVIQPEFIETIELTQAENSEVFIERIEAVETQAPIKEPIEKEKAAYASASDLKTALNRKKVLELKEMVMKNENIALSKEEVEEMFKKDLINLLLSEFNNQNKNNNQKGESE